MSEQNHDPPLRISHKYGVDEASTNMQIRALTIIRLADSDIARSLLVLVRNCIFILAVHWGFNNVENFVDFGDVLVRMFMAG